ncbi:hypothetical protein [Mesorhizobium sp. SP-1A]|uniref:hypothetical protein n=1 Tax=Mesorhizobium sp. SP-1A TaxID=3077840 RepID=UPI0028F7244C|nr:hypothetical protein [Mesorhizobium sp. SP-1A]
MRLRYALAGACLLALGAAAPAAELPAKGTDGWKLAGSLERHWTSNVLDSDYALPDWYTLLRGSLHRRWGDEDAYAALRTEFEASRHDTVTLEDDRALALSGEVFRRLSNGAELRGTLAYNAASTGDDVQIGPVVLGTRTTKQVAGAGLQVGFDLGDATSLILEAADNFEMVGRTHFQNDLLPASRLDPDRNRLQFSLRLTRTRGALAFGGSASALLESVEQLGSPPVALSFRQYGLRGEIAFAGKDGSALGLALGAEWLGDRDRLYSRVRPAWQVTFSKPLIDTLELRGSFIGRYESADSDDPLASWLRRGELEIAFKPRQELLFGAGLACQTKENLLFENKEHTRSLFAEAVYELGAPASLVFRVDYSRTFKTVIDIRQSTVDAFVGLRTKI